MKVERDGDQIQILECRAGCAACCIAPSISSPIPGMPRGKAAGARCVQLTEDYRCGLFGKPERPAVCASLQPSGEMCGGNTKEAFQILTRLERTTRPGVTKELSRLLIQPERITPFENASSIRRYFSNLPKPADFPTIKVYAQALHAQPRTPLRDA